MNDLVLAQEPIIRHLVKYYEDDLAPVEDLIQAGFLGAAIAARRYDHKKGDYKNLAYFHIRNEIDKESRRWQKLRIPADRDRLRRRLRTDFDVAVDTLDDVFRNLLHCHRGTLRALWRAEIVQWLAEDAAAGVAAPAAEPPEEEPGQNLETKLQCLRYREREVLRHRFGLSGYEQKTLEGTAKMFSVSRERARQIMVGALAKLAREFRVGERRTG